MKEYKMIYDYRNHKEYRKSFNDLAILTYGINFEKWYQDGYWNDNYINYSYVDNDTVIANISINFLDVIMNNEKKKAIQIGTVMTHPDYQKKGLAHNLMSTILNKYEDTVDFIYLYANETVMDFYPRYGFKLTEESEFILPVNKSDDKTSYKKLDIKNQKDLDLLLHLTKNKYPLSNTLDTFHDEHLVRFYCTNVFQDFLYYLEDLNAITVFEIDQDTLHLFGIISDHDINQKVVIDKIISPSIKQIVFHFTPNFVDENLIIKIKEDNELFVKGTQLDFPKNFLFPLLSQS